MFDNFSGIDRQTELNDDDGTLTGLTNNLAKPIGTISVNQDPYFTAPVEVSECRSNLESVRRRLQRNPGREGNPDCQDQSRRLCCDRSRAAMLTDAEGSEIWPLQR
jgi:hypothetical protein